jgi:TolB-like protein/Tfp pilus assembly protein PilF
MSFWQELRQRRVIRIAVSYIVVAWVLLQVGDTLFPVFDIPGWGMRLLILVLALGLPLAMVAGWAVQRTPDGLRWDVRSRGGGLRIGALAATVAAVALLWYFMGKPAIEQQVIREERSIAVMPFANLSSDRSNSYFSDGLAETTLDMLTRVHGLKVIARDSSFGLRGSEATPAEIGHRLGAANILEGSVQQAGNLLRITATLVRTRDGARLWSRRFDRSREDVFSIQDEIALEVVKALKTLLPKEEENRLLDQGTANAAAYEEYMRGLESLPQQNVESLLQAKAHFEKALELDPAYARAHVGVARALFGIGLTRGLDVAGWKEHAREAQRALELAPDLGEAHIQQGIVLVDQDDMAAAEREFRRGLELAPGYANGYEAIANLLYATNRADEGLRMIARAVALDPLDANLRLSYSGALGQVGRMDESESQVDRVLENDPGFAQGYQQKAMLRMLQGDLKGALQSLQQGWARDPRNYELFNAECGLYLEFGAYAELDACLERIVRRFPRHDPDPVYQQQAWVADGSLLRDPGKLERTEFDEPIDKASLLAQLGRNAEALDVLRRGGDGLLAANPDIEQRPLSQVLAVGGMRLHGGDPGGGRRLLEAGLRRAQSLAIGPTPHLRQWNEAIALGLLGRDQDACAAIRANGDAGIVTAWRRLDLAANLEALHHAPCYEMAMQPIRKRAADAVQEARDAGLVPDAGTEAGSDAPPPPR